MRKLILILMICALPAYSSECSVFAQREYAQQFSLKKTHIVVKKEHTEIYAQEIGCHFIPYITYGYGDLKSKNQRKQRATYACLMDYNKKPIWSYIAVEK